MLTKLMLRIDQGINGLEHLNEIEEKLLLDDTFREKYQETSSNIPLTYWYVNVNLYFYLL